MVVILVLGFLANNYKNQIKNFFGFATVISSLDNATTEGWHIHGYAWGENTGWIDFGTTLGATYVSDTALYGSAYGENIGWIVLNPTGNGGVSNDGDGHLSGFAWGENVGWVDFGTTTNITSRTYGVNIATTTGVFSGYAWGENVGWINFTNGTASTTWVPAIARTCDGGLGGTIANGASLTYYETATVPFTKHCTSESRVCTDGSLSGTYTYPTCIVGTKASGSKPLQTTSTTTVATTTTDTGAIKVITPPTATTTGGQGGDKDTGTGAAGGQNLPPIKTVEIPVVVPETLTLTDLPTFGGTSSGAGSFTFVSSIDSFLFAPLPDAITSVLKKSPDLKNYLASVGFSRVQDFVSLTSNSIPLPASQNSPLANLFTVTKGTATLKTFITNDSNYNLVQLVRVAPNTPLTISLIPINKNDVTGKWNDRMISFSSNINNSQVTFDLISPKVSGRYFLVTPASLLPLAVEVIATPTQSATDTKPVTWWSIVLGWFGR